MSCGRCHTCGDRVIRVPGLQREWCPRCGYQRLIVHRNCETAVPRAMIRSAVREARRAVREVFG